MNTLTILGLGSIVPCFLVVYFIYKLDDFQEPLHRMILAFILGIFSPLITLQISGALDFGFTSESHPWLHALLMAAIPEECGKLLILAYIAWRWKDVREPFDLLVYASAVWSGFSACENFLYSLGELADEKSPLWLLATRSTLCTLAHISWGLIIGAYVAIARFTQENTLSWISRGLFLSVVLHFLYDGLLMSAKGSDYVYLNIGLAAGIDLITLFIAFIFLIRIEKLQGLARYEGHEV